MATQSPRQLPRSTAARVAPDAWADALQTLDSATTPEEREQALVRFTTQVAAGLPHLARHRASIIALMRTSLAADAIAEELAGEPQTLVDLVDLPRFTDADVMVETSLRAQVRSRVLGVELLTASAVSELVGSKSKNLRTAANRMRIKGELLGVPQRNTYLYPAFQFDAERRALRPAVAAVNPLLHASEDPWGAASWWLDANGRLGGSAPVDLLGDAVGDAAVLEAALSLAEDDA